MCGIVGLLSRGSGSHLESVGRGCDLLKHRGPEAFGLWTASAFRGNSRIAFGHRRLSIIDVSERSAQPLLLTPGGHVRPAASEIEAPAHLALTFNGEIYNYLELRAELQALGHRFATTGDAEVLLLAYRQWGPSCLHKLNGMFAFAFWDAAEEQLFIARDRFGEKPLHYVVDAERGLFAFASEVKALVGMGAAVPELDAGAVYRYFCYGAQASVDGTIWKNVRRLLPGHCMTVRFVDDKPALEFRRYWTPPSDRRETLNAQEAVAEFRELFADSVRLRLRSDVPVGSSLSGGVDSSSVVCQVHRLGAAAGQLSFTARMDDPKLDESRYAEMVTAATGVSGHYVMPTVESFLDQIDHLFYHQEEPFPTTSIFASYLVQQLARDYNVTVLLDGQGADEYLGGYAHYPSALLIDLAVKGRFSRWYRERKALVKRTGDDPVPPKAALWYWCMARLNSHNTESRVRRSNLSFLHPELVDKHCQDSLIPRHQTGSRFDNIMRGDLLDGHLQELLRYADRNSMAFSREIRLPFLDHRLVEFALTLPLDFIYRDGESKWVLRQAMRGTVPDEVLNRRDKVGFATPWQSWSQGEHSWALQERLRSAAHELADFVRPNAVSIGSAEALGIMAIASTRHQFRNLSKAALAA